MNDTDYKNYRAEQILSQCGLNQDSINSIKSTSVVTHNGSQHVIHNSQSHLFDKKDVNTVDMSNANELLAVHQQQFSRFKQYADTRIMRLESQMSQVMEQLKTATDIIQTLRSNSQAANNRAQLEQNNAPRDPVKEAIDRNRVAPADVCIEKMFYFGNT